MVTAWTVVIALVVLLLALDIAALSRRPRAPGVLESLGQTFLWLAMAGAFNAFLWLAVFHDWQGIGTAMAPALEHATRGVELAAAGGDEQRARLLANSASIQFLTGFLTELALDLDTVLVIAAIFAARRTPARVQHLVLYYGLLVALVPRGAMIGLTGWALQTFEWSRFVLSGLLVLATLRMLLVRQENADPERNIFVRLISRLFPVAERAPSAEMITRVNGRLVLTPLLVTLLLIETADAFFAVDSIPAVYAGVKAPFLVFTSNVFALLVLRSMYFTLRRFAGWIRYMKIALAALLAYSAVKIGLPQHLDPTPFEGLVVVASLIAAGFGAAVLFARPAEVASTSPLGEDAERLARLTLKQARKLIVLVVGVTIVGLGVLMTIGPGPGLLVIPIGLALLATEFVWAKRVMDKYGARAAQMGQKAGGALVKRTPLWVVPVTVGLTLGALAAVAVYRPFGLSPALVLPGSIPLLIGQTVWAVLTVRKWRRGRAGGGEAGAAGAAGASGAAVQPGAGQAAANGVAPERDAAPHTATQPAPQSAPQSAGDHR